MLLDPDMQAVLAALTGRAPPAGAAAAANDSAAGQADLRLLGAGPVLRAAGRAGTAAGDVRMEDLGAYAEGLSRAAGRPYLILGVLRSAGGGSSGGGGAKRLELNPPRGAPLRLLPGDGLVALRGRPVVAGCP